jgi:RHS repeat-associated protein
MPTPNAASLGKYGDIPVGNFTGVPSINIPIASVTEGPLSLPINLGYHSSGIKLGETPSWVGLGFSLNAGGVITRTMRGLPDDHRFNGYYNNAVSNYALSADNVEAFYIEHGYSNGVDMESDLYSFNFLGYSGKFFFGRDKKVHFTPRQDLKVEVGFVDAAHDHFRSFTIITPDGTKFKFGLLPNESYVFDNSNPSSAGGIEVTKPFSKSTDPGYTDKNLAYISSWYLRQISTYDGRYSINLDYETEDYAYNQSTTCTNYINYFSPNGTAVYSDASLGASCDGDAVSFPADPTQLWEPGVGGQATKNYLCNWIKIRGSRIKSITNSSNTMAITFNTEGRDDIEIYPDEPNSGGGRLGSIEIASSDKCQKYAFEYDYFLDYRYPSKKESKRLQLTAVKQKNCSDNILIGAYSFSYNGTKKGAQNKIFIPHRLSPESDHWGFYNAENNNNIQSLENFIPATEFMSTLNNGTKVNVKFSSLVKREQPQSGVTPMLIGMLDKITYPTGGCTNLEYEANTVYVKEKTIENIVDLSSTASNCNNSQESGLVTFTAAMIASSTLMVSLSCNGECTSNHSTACVKFKDANNNVIYTRPLYENYNCSSTNSAGIANEVDLSTFLTPGTYKVELITTNGDASLSINKKIEQFINKRVGGLRIKSITSKVSETDNILIVKNYKYTDPTTNNANSSGKLLFKPRYYFHAPVNVNSSNKYAPMADLGVNPEPNEPLGLEWADLFVFKSSPTVPLTDLVGYHIGYEYVTEETTNFGKKETKYYAQIYDDGSNTPYPYVLEGYNAKNGNVITEKIYDKNGVLKSAMENIPYEDVVTTITTNNRLSQVPGLYTSVISCNPCRKAAVLFKNYNLTTTLYRVKKTITKMDGITNETEHKYYTQNDYPVFPYLTTTSNSDGKFYRTKNVYVHELSATANTGTTSATADIYMTPALRAALIDRNIISSPIVTTTGVTNDVTSDLSTDKIISGQITGFNFFAVSAADATSMVVSTTTTNPIYLEKFYNLEYAIGSTAQKWQLGGTIVSYETATKKPKEYRTDGWNISEFYNWQTNGLIKERNFGGLKWQYHLYPNTGLVDKITDENGLIKTFSYDNLMRLDVVKDRVQSDGLTNPQTTTTNTYHYRNGASDNNYISSSTAIANGSNAIPLSTKQYFDGLGRPNCLVKENYGPNNGAGQNLKICVTYDALGRQERVYQPFQSLNTDLETAPSSGIDFKRTEYEESFLSRPIRQYAEDNTFVEMRYGANTKTLNGTNPSSDLTKDDVRKFTVVAGRPSDVQLVNVSLNGLYDENTLSKTRIWNENATTNKPANTDLNDIYVGRTDVFKDKLGRVILTRKFCKNASGVFVRVDTYNVYDDYGNLVLVIPPEAINASNVIQYAICFQYIYDSERKLSEKKVPNADFVRYYYNSRDLLALIQDGNMRLQNKYLGTVYDDLGRVVKTGFVTSNNPNNITISDALNDANRMTRTLYYPNSSWVQHQEAKVLNHSDVPTIRSHVWSYIERRAGYTYTGNPIWTAKQHLLSKTYRNGWSLIADDGPINDYDYGGVDWSVSAYDGLQKPTLSIRYLFSGQSGSWQQAQEVRQSQTFMYDNGQRLAQTNYMYALQGAGITATPQFELTNMTYNARDLVTIKKTALVNNKYLQSTNFGYNRRNWLESINSGFANSELDLPLFSPANEVSSSAYEDIMAYGRNTPLANSGEHNPDLFKEIIRYGNPFLIPAGVTTDAQYNGNISQIEYQVAGDEAQAYSFKYDNLDRLTEANYADIHSVFGQGTPWANHYESDKKFQEKLTYDLRGNIKSLTRKGTTYDPQLFDNGVMYGNFGDIDNLTYHYNDPNNSNKLTGVTDGSHLSKGFKTEYGNNDPTVADYTYDANGNITSDLNKGITNIQYNYLNLPTKITCTNPIGGGSRYIYFVYDASGQKHQKITKDINCGFGGCIYPEPVTYTYVNGIEYKNGVLQRFAHTEGAVALQSDNTTYAHEYVIKDHLGNTRVTYRDDDKLGSPLGTIKVDEIVQINHFYPYGLNMEGTWNGSFPEAKNKYQYNGKELNTDFGLDLSDYGARFYDAAIGRFSSRDRFTEKYLALTPYQYGANNPIRFIDINGDSIKPGEGQRAEFVAEFNQVIDKLKKIGEDGPYQQMEGSLTIYKLQEETGTTGEAGSRFDPTTNTLYWNPRVALFFDETFVIISPATILSHEIDHGGRYDKEKEDMKIDQRTPDAKYSNKEEKRVITGSEQRVAKGFGEIKEGEVTRTDHLRATSIPVTGPFSYEIPNTVIDTKVIKKN